MGETLNQRRRVWDDRALPRKPLSGGKKSALWVPGQYLQRKDRLTTCQQPRQYVGSKRCPELLGVRGVQAGLYVKG